MDQSFNESLFNSVVNLYKILKKNYQEIYADLIQILNLS